MADTRRIAALLNGGKADKDNGLIGDLISEYFGNDEDLEEGTIVYTVTANYG